MWLFLFALKTKLERSSAKCCWRTIEGESPLYTCSDPDALQPWTSLTTLTSPLMQHDRKRPLTCTWSGSNSSLHLKPAKDNRSWCWLTKSSDAVWFQGRTWLSSYFPCDDPGSMSSLSPQQQLASCCWVIPIRDACWCRDTQGILPPCSSSLLTPQPAYSNYLRDMRQVESNWTDLVLTEDQVSGV